MTRKQAAEFRTAQRQAKRDWVRALYLIVFSPRKKRTNKTGGVQ